MRVKTKNDIIRLITLIGFTFQDDYISMNNTRIEVYEMDKLIIRFHNDEVTLNHDDENSYIFYHANYNLAYKDITKYFKVEYRKAKIGLLNE